MILSKQDEFEWKNAITVTRVSTNTIDLGATNRDIAVADDLWLVGQVTTAFTASGAGTLACDFIQSANADLSSADTLVPLMAATGKATLIAGYSMFNTRLPIGKITKRYIGLSWTVATGPMTAGAVMSGFTPNPEAWRSFARGYVNY